MNPNKPSAGLPQVEMSLKILLPFQVFAEHSRVQRIVAETRQGCYGLLAHRLDCVAALVPGILVFQSAGGAEQYVAIDEGVLVKAGQVVTVSVRRALAGSSLDQLHAVVEKEFLTLDEQERSTRALMTKLETGLVHRLAGLCLGARP